MLTQVWLLQENIQLKLLYIQLSLPIWNGFLLVNNGIRIIFGHYYLNLNLGGYGVSTTYSPTLPIACTANYSADAVPRNSFQMDIGVVEPNLATLNFALHNNSANTQHVYGVYYIVIGY